MQEAGTGEFEYQPAACPLCKLWQITFLLFQAHFLSSKQGWYHPPHQWGGVRRGDVLSSSYSAPLEADPRNIRAIPQLLSFGSHDGDATLSVEAMQPTLPGVQCVFLGHISCPTLSKKGFCNATSLCNTTHVATPVNSADPEMIGLHPPPSSWTRAVRKTPEVVVTVKIKPNPRNRAKTTSMADILQHGHLRSPPPHSIVTVAEEFLPPLHTLPLFPDPMGESYHPPVILAKMGAVHQRGLPTWCSSLPLPEHFLTLKIKLYPLWRRAWNGPGTWNMFITCSMIYVKGSQLSLVEDVFKQSNGHSPWSWCHIWLQQMHVSTEGIPPIL